MNLRHETGSQLSAGDGNGGRIIRRGRVLGSVGDGDGVNVIKTFLLLLLVLLNHNFADGASRCRPVCRVCSPQLPPSLPPLPFSSTPPSKLLDWVIALLIKCISYALTFYLCMRAQVEPQSTHGTISPPPPHAPVALCGLYPCVHSIYTRITHASVMPESPEMADNLTMATATAKTGEIYMKIENQIEESRQEVGRGGAGVG